MVTTDYSNSTAQLGPDILFDAVENRFGGVSEGSALSSNVIRARSLAMGH